MVAIAADSGNDPDIRKLQGDLRERRARARAAEQLGYRFVARARLSNDAGFYKVAEQAAACVESIEPDDPAALLLRGHVLHQMHRFGDAEKIARRLVALREFVLDFGLLGDALMEQGRLEEAAVAYQKMIDLKPFYQSYTRAAHLRWLKGDLDGAIEMLHAAVKAASPRDRESVAWAYARLAVYELQRGRLDEAERMAGASLQFVPDYAAALLARGRIQLALQKERGSGRHPREGRAPEPAPRIPVDACRRAALRSTATTRRSRSRPPWSGQAMKTRARWPFTCPHGARTAQKPWTWPGASSKTAATSSRSMRWRGRWPAPERFDDASALMSRALAEGTQDGRLFLHAAVIAAADGRPADAARWARKARALRFTLLPSELGVLRTGIVTTPHVRG